MSVIAVRVTASQVEMAVDSEVSYGDIRVSRSTSIADQKLWAVNGLMVAFVGTSSLGSILRRWTRDNVPEGGDEPSICRYVDAFHSWRRETYPDGGDIGEVSFVLAFHGQAWIVDAYAVSAVPRGGYFADGAGMTVALGALFCGASVEDAARAACYHNGQCGLPVIVGTMREYAIGGTVEHLSPMEKPNLIVPEMPEAKEAA